MNFSFFTFSRVGVGLLSLGIISSFTDVRAAQLDAIAKQTPLQVFRNACLNGDIATVEFQIASGISFDSYFNQMLLPQAAAAGHVDVCAALIAAGAPINAYDSSTALTIAVDRGNLEVVRKLLRAGAMITVADIAAAVAAEVHLSTNRLMMGKGIVAVCAPAFFTGAAWATGSSPLVQSLGAIATIAGIYYQGDTLKKLSFRDATGKVFGRPSGLGLGKPSILAELYARGARPISEQELKRSSNNRAVALSNFSLIKAVEKQYWRRKALIEQTVAIDDSECAEELASLILAFERNQPDSPGYNFNRVFVIQTGFDGAEKGTAQKLAELITMFEQDQVAWCPYNLRQIYARKRELLGESLNGATNLVNLIESFGHDKRITTHDSLAV